MLEPLFADAGLPMIVLTLPGMLALLLPVIWIEAWLCRRWLGISNWESVKSNAVANVISTLVGMPVAWCLALVFEVFVFGTISEIPSFQHWNSPLALLISTIFGSAWLAPDERNIYWMIPVATIVLLVPTFFVSIWIEAAVMRRMLGAKEEAVSALSNDRIWIAVRNANLITYGFLVVGSSAWLLVSLIGHRH